MKAANILETIGNTPHIRINRLFGDKAEVWIKSERSNPAASIKDRIALSMVEDAERSGKLKARRGDRRADQRQYRHRPGDGGRGQGLSADPRHAGQHVGRAAAADAGLWRRIRPDPARKGHEGRHRPGPGNHRPDAGSWMPQQFDNPANIDVHVRTTAQEILADFGDQPLDALITGVGTGGHITGCAQVLKRPGPGSRCSPSSRPCRPSFPAASPRRIRSRESAPDSSRSISMFRCSTG